MQDAGLPLPKPLPTLYETISADEDAVLRTIMQITSGAYGAGLPLPQSVRGSTLLP